MQLLSFHAFSPSTSHKRMEKVHRGWQSDDVLNMLKTGLTVYTAEEIADIENYIFTWKLNGRKGWLNPFEKHPDGYGKPVDEAVKEKLSVLNAIRTGITEPLVKFANALREGNGLTDSNAVYMLLTDFELDKTLPHFLHRLRSPPRRRGHVAVMARHPVCPVSVTAQRFIVLEILLSAKP